MITINNILVATDFQPASDNALSYGRALARRFGARLHVLHVPVNVLAAIPSADGRSDIPTDFQREVEEAARRQIEGLLTDEERRAGQVIAATVTASSPARAIVDYARHHDIDLLVLGTHGRGPLSHIVLGSVAERVVRTAPCPVLTVRDPEREFVSPDVTAVAAGER